MTLDQFLDKWRAVPVRTRGLALIAALTALLIGMAAIEHIKRFSGAEIVLAARPVDPRDILRGAYVAIDYDIEIIDLGAVEHADDFARMGPGPDMLVWLVLKPDGETWRVSRVLKARPPALTADEVALQALWTNRGYLQPPTDQPMPAPIEMRVDIGADRYFANEARAKQLEQSIRDGDFQVVLSVGRGGKAVIKALVLNGQRQDETFF